MAFFVGARGAAAVVHYGSGPDQRDADFVTVAKRIAESLQEKVPFTNVIEAKAWLASPKIAGRLSEIKELNLRSSGIHFLPKEVALLKGLEHLFLCDNALMELPSEIGDLASLVSLHVTHNKLRSLPSEIGKLSLLMALHINNNELEGLPSEIGDLGALELVQAHHNPLKSLPREISRLTKLKPKSFVVDANFELLKTVPEEMAKIVVGVV